MAKAILGPLHPAGLPVNAVEASHKTDVQIFWVMLEVKPPDHGILVKVQKMPFHPLFHQFVIGLFHMYTPTKGAGPLAAVPPCFL